MFLTVLEIEHWQELFVSRRLWLLVPWCGRRGKRVLGGPFYKGTDRTHEGLTFRNSLPPKTPPWGLGFQQLKFGESQTFHP